MAIIFRTVCAILTVPFAILSFFYSSPEKVKYVQDKVALPLPHRLLTFVSQFAHLTVVSHEMTSGYFAWAVLNEYGVLKASGSWLELYFVVATSVALFVAIVFWGSALVDPALMAPVDVILPAHYQLTPDFKQHLLFGAMFGPTDPEPACSWQTPFRLFMQYVHTLCPLLMVADMMVAEHPLGQADMEINATLCFALGYLAWNFFCWWLLQTPPYPLQKRFFELGVPWALFAYSVLSIFAMSLCIYIRWVRAVGGIFGGALSVALVCWASTGLQPWRGELARIQGLDPEVLMQGWQSGGRSAFLTKEAEIKFISQSKAS
ncbi:unnamed protein product [Durusdinium trenchii]|uniref:Uncharacterized protein n=2 Tax=Durusdinium trenchii TaxID=1381693 RepID=A0ABP0PW32_9DINO